MSTLSVFFAIHYFVLCECFTYCAVHKFSNTDILRILILNSNLFLNVLFLFGSFLSYSFSLCHSAIWRLGDPWISFQWCRAVPSHLGPPRVRRPITCGKEECQGSGIKEESHLILCHPVPVKESKLQLDVSKSIV